VSYFVIIRGPMAVGKTMIAKKIANAIGGRYFEVDRVREEAGLLKEPKEQGYVSQSTFFKINNILVPEVKEYLDKKIPVVFDGNFYWMSTIEDLIKKLNYQNYVFTLLASRDTCIQRDKHRERPHGEDAVRAVHKKATSFRYGIEINTAERSPESIAEEILKKIK